MDAKDPNELIHEFMGHDWTKEQFQWRPGATTPMTVEHLKHYETTWNWLIPVVEKIMNIKYPDGENCYLRTFGMISEESDLVMVRFNRQQLFEAETLLKATYLAVSSFVSGQPKGRE